MKLGHPWNNRRLRVTLRTRVNVDSNKRQVIQTAESIKIRLLFRRPPLLHLNIAIAAFHLNSVSKSILFYRSWTVTKVIKLPWISKTAAIRLPSTDLPETLYLHKPSTFL